MPTLQLSVTAAGLGVNIQQQVNRSADGGIAVEASLPAGKAGTLTTRATDTTGTVTLSTGHGIATGNIVDLYWSGGRRYGVVAGTVSGNDVPISGGAGDILPAQTTAVVMSKQVTINAAIDGDAVKAIVVCPKFATPTEASKLHATFKDAASVVIKELDMVANVPQIWDIEGGATNVFTGNPITVCYASNGSSAEAATLQILGVVDTTP